MNINKILAVNNTTLTNDQFGRELFMESFLVEHPEILKLDDLSDSVEIVGYEVPITGCNRVNTDNGRADIVAIYPSSDGDTVAIIELKNAKLTKAVITDQLSKYIEHKAKMQLPDVQERLEKAKRWIGIIVGTDIDLSLANEIVTTKDKSEEPTFGAITLKRYKDEAGNMYVISDTYFPDDVKTSFQLKVTYTPESKIEEEVGVPTDVFVNTILKIGIEKCKALDLKYDNKKHDLISDHKYDDTTGHRSVADGKWWILTHCSTDDKKKRLEKIRDMINKTGEKCIVKSIEKI